MIRLFEKIHSTIGDEPGISDKDAKLLCVPRGGGQNHIFQR